MGSEKWRRGSEEKGLCIDFTKMDCAIMTKEEKGIKCDMDIEVRMIKQAYLSSKMDYNRRVL